MERKISISSEEIKKLRTKIFEKFVNNLKEVYAKKIVTIEDIKELIERDDLTYLK